MIYSDIKYGYLYNWRATELAGFVTIADFSIPTFPQYNIMKDFLTPSEGTQMKTTTEWETSTGTNTSGFSGFPSGFRDGGTFTDKALAVYWWTSSEFSATTGFYRRLLDLSIELSSGNKSKIDGLYVRLVYTGTGTPASRVRDYDGNIYDVIQIGTQYWTKQNYACTRLNDGTLIPNITDDIEWVNDTLGAYCAYDNDPTNAITPVPYSDTITKHNVDLYPTGNFFSLNIESIIYKVNDAIGLYMSRAYASVRYLMDAILPDSDRFDIVALEDWEKAYGIVAAGSFDERVAILIQRFQFPGDVLARQSAVYIQDQLQLAGFDVYVKYNRFDVPVVLESRAGFIIAGLSRAGGERVNEYRFERHEPEVGYTELIANNIDPVRDSTIFDRSAGSAAGFIRSGRDRAYSGTIADREVQLRGTFFISDAVYPALATVSIERKKEFRDLILRLKPAQMVGFLYINYI